MIGGAIHSYVEVNGAVVSRKKKGDRVALWTSKKTAKINLDIWSVTHTERERGIACIILLYIIMMAL